MDTIITATLPQRDELLMGVAAPIAQGTAAERLSAALRKHVGRERAWSIERFRRKIGASASAVEKMMAADYTPSLATLLTMKRELPPAFTNDLIELSRLTGARRLDGEAKSAAMIATGLAEETALIVRALQDGHLDHREKAMLRGSLARLAVEIEEFIAKLGGG